jgi:hypothetical protein
MSRVQKYSMNIFYLICCVVAMKLPIHMMMTNKHIVLKMLLLTFIGCDCRYILPDDKTYRFSCRRYNCHHTNNDYEKYAKKYNSISENNRWEKIELYINLINELLLMLLH